MSSLIICENIVKIYQSGTAKTKALNSVSFSINQGELVAIMGRSGSGKTTLMNILGALDIPTEGTYILDNKDVSKLSDDQLADIRKKKIGFVFQSFNLLSRANVLRNVMLPLIYTQLSLLEREKKVKRALDLVGIGEKHWSHLSNQLSGGQMQRVAIARALVNNPAIILADEPTGNLDTKTGELVLSSFQDLNEQGRTIILITHERYVAEHAARIITLSDGMIESDEKVTQQRRLKNNY
ncbi:ABC transporter ATP-binding protein [Patescibacteria group bacterium]|nr:ABC transporter ATP-binding protein [Patescibacteria group bacterium]